MDPGNHEFEEIEPDYDDDDNESEQKPDPDEQSAQSDVYGQQLNSYQEFHVPQTRGALTQSESISMGALSEYSRFSGKTSGGDDPLTDYTTDGGSDREGVIKISIEPRAREKRRNSIRDIGDVKLAQNGAKIHYGAMHDDAARENFVDFIDQRPLASHFQIAEQNKGLGNKSGRKRIRKSSKDLSASQRPVIAYEQQFSISDGEKETNHTAPIAREASASSMLQVPSMTDSEPVNISSHPRVRKKSSNTSVEVDMEELENDKELGDHLNAMIRQRRRSFRGTKKGKNISRKRSLRLSNRSRDGEGPISSDDVSARVDGYLDLFRQDAAPSDVEVRDNIRIQKEIISDVRMQPWSMRRKLRTLRLAKAYVERYEGRLSRGKGYQEAGAKYWRLFKREFINFASVFVPWEMRIKRIESHFGSVVSSYFTFLRWLFWLNIVITLISVGFIVVPEVVVGDPIGSTPRKSVPEDERDDALNLEVVMDWGGYIKHSFLFYGYYGDEVEIGSGYRLPLAYFLAGLAVYAVSFVIILRKMAKNSRVLNLSSQDEQYVFTWKTFTMWDYMIGNAETSKNKSAEILTNFREVILEEQEKKREKNKKVLILLRIIANFLVIAVLASSTYAIYLLVLRSHDVEEQVARGEKINWFTRNEVSLAMSLITAIFPSIFDLIGLMEKYHPRVNLRWQLARILVLYFLNLYTLTIALYGKITDSNTAFENQCNATNQLTTASMTSLSTSQHVTTALPLSTNVTHTPNSTAAEPGVFLNYKANCTQSTELCWETMIGQEMCKLSFFDTLTTVGMVILIDFIRGLFVRVFGNCWCWDLERKFPEYGEFKIAENLLHLIYNQATTWLGAFFAPALPGLNLVKLLILLYIRSWAVLVCNIPHERVFRASKSNNFYYAITLLMLFLVALLVGFLLVSLEPSKTCGPFTGYTRTYEVFSQTLNSLLPDSVQPILDYVVSPGIIIPVFLLLFMAIYYLASVTRSLKAANKDLREQLLYERTEEKRKIYAMADARNGMDKKGINITQNTDRVEPFVRNNTAASYTQTLPASQMSRPAGVESSRLAGHSARPAGHSSRPPKVVRVPGMSLEQAAALKNKNPNVRIMTAEQARRLNILPSNKRSKEGQRVEQERSRVNEGHAPPIAVVHGKPSDSRRMPHIVLGSE